MARLSLLVFAFCLFACAEQSGQIVQTNPSKQIDSTKYVWTKLSDSAEWKKSYNFEMFSIRDTLWVFHFDGNWYSTKGINWIRSTLPNAIGNISFLDYVYFNGAMYGLGSFEGNIDNFKLKNKIYKTSDFKHWDTVALQSNLPKRFFYHPFVFDNKIWIIGGEDEKTQYADIWNSTDGIQWMKQKDNLPFGKRSRSQIVQFQNKLFLLENDVWSSKDGLTWQKETGEILKRENIFGYAAVVFDNKIWLIGCNRNGKFLSQVLVSADGKNWETQTAPWSPRGAVAATVHKNKIYMTGGKYGGITQDGTTTDFVYSNDIWSVEKTRN